MRRLRTPAGPACAGAWKSTATQPDGQLNAQDGMILGRRHPNPTYPPVSHLPWGRPSTKMMRGWGGLAASSAAGSAVAVVGCGAAAGTPGPGPCSGAVGVAVNDAAAFAALRRAAVQSWKVTARPHSLGALFIQENCIMCVWEALHVHSRVMVAQWHDDACKCWHALHKSW